MGRQMIKDLKNIQDTVHRQTCLIRNIYTLVHSKSFETIYLNADQKVRKGLNHILETGLYHLIPQWFDDQRFHQKRFLTLRELRTMAINYGIQNVASFSKGQLLEMICEKQHRGETPRDEESPGTDTVNS